MSIKKKGWWKDLFRRKPTRVTNLDHIRKWEKLRLKAYLPTKHDVWTIGYGHTKDVVQGMEITGRTAERFLREDLKWVERTIHELVKVPLTQKQFNALGGFIFNVGRSNFKRSSVLRRLNTYDYVGAADSMLMWNKQRQNGKLVILRGLTRRREDERRLFLEGTKK